MGRRVRRTVPQRKEREVERERLALRDSVVAVPVTKGCPNGPSVGRWSGEKSQEPFSFI